MKVALPSASCCDARLGNTGDVSVQHKSQWGTVAAHEKGQCAPCVPSREPAPTASPPGSPVSVEDSFHLRDVGFQRDGTEFIELLIVEQQVLVPETNGFKG